MTTRFAVVTGSSTGIGQATVERLAFSGWHVWGGVRSAADAQRISQTSGVNALRMDVTDDSEIGNAFGEVEKEISGSGLDLLVVNAGVVVAGPIEFLTREQWREQLEVNVVGVASTIRAALPLMSDAEDPRIIVVGSINSRVGVPLLGPYVASKHALVGLLSSLRRELPARGPRITLLEPGAVRTPLWDKAREASQRFDSEVSNAGSYGYEDLIRNAQRRLNQEGHRGMNPSKVAAIIEQFANRARPPKRRLIGRDARLAAVGERMLGGRVLDFVLQKFRS